VSQSLDEPTLRRHRTTFRRRHLRKRTVRGHDDVPEQTKLIWARLVGTAHHLDKPISIVMIKRSRRVLEVDATRLLRRLPSRLRSHECHVISIDRRHATAAAAAAAAAAGRNARRVNLRHCRRRSVRRLPSVQSGTTRQKQACRIFRRRRSWVPRHPRRERRGPPPKRPTLQVTLRLIERTIAALAVRRHLRERMIRHHTFLLVYLSPVGYRLRVNRRVLRARAMRTSHRKRHDVKKTSYRYAELNNG
jgi:hypothetical protein